VRLEPFGAFVEIAPGVEGLVHISAMAERHITHPREILSLGQELQVTVVSLDRERRRIGLSLIEEIRAAQAAVAATLTLGSRMRVRVERVESNGVIVRVLVPNVLETTFPRGLIPNNELNVPRGSDLKKLFPTGRELVAAVQSVDGEGRVRLSLRAVTEPEVAAAPPAEIAPAAKPVEPVATAAEPEVAPAAKPARARTTRSKKTPVPAEAVADAAAPASAEPAEAPAPARKPAARRKAAAGEAAGTEAEPAAKKKPSARTPQKAAAATPAPAEADSVADRPAAAAPLTAAPVAAARKKPAATEAAPDAAEPAKAGRRVCKSA
jgi:predicted RNA-binding protein with RPS1 domain